MYVFVKDFGTYDIHTSNDVNDSNSRSYDTWIPPKLFNPLRFCY